MSRHLLMGDIHLRDTPPSSCTPSYNDDIFDILRYVCTDVVREYGVSSVILAGDTFDNKTPSRNSHANVRRFIELARACPVPVLAVPGNHDVQYDQLETLPRQPLGVVFASGAVTPLIGWSAARAGLLDVPIYGVPWLPRFDDTAVADALADWRALPLAASGIHGLVVAHAPLYPVGQENPYENYPATRWAAAMGGYGSCYYGHVHEYHGVHTAAGVTFANPGAISRGSLHEHNLTRGVRAAVWDSTTGTFDIIDLPHRPAEEVFLLTEANARRVKTLATDELIAAIGRAQVEVVSIESVRATIRAIPDITPELIATTDELLDIGAERAAKAVK